MDIETCNDFKALAESIENGLPNRIEHYNRGYTEKEIKSEFESMIKWKEPSNCTSHSWFTQEIGDRGIIDNGIYQFPIMNYSPEFVFIHRK